MDLTDHSKVHCTAFLCSGSRGCSKNTFVINSLINIFINSLSQSSFVKISSEHLHSQIRRARQCPALMVADGAFSHKYTMFKLFWRFKILKGIKIVLLVQELWHLLKLWILPIAGAWAVDGLQSTGLPHLFSRPGRSQGLLYKHLCHSFADWLIL